MGTVRQRELSLVTEGVRASHRRVDETFGSYVEDVDYCFRAWDAGWKVAGVISETIGTKGSVLETKRRLTRRNGILLAHKRRGSQGVAGLSSTMLINIARNVIGAAFYLARRKPDRARQSLRRAYDEVHAMCSSVPSLLRQAKR